MKTFFAALAVLTLVLGTISIAAPSSASAAYLFPPKQNEGSSN